MRNESSYSSRPEACRDFFDTCPALRKDEAALAAMKTRNDVNCIAE
jgi:hypothetical protein